MLATLVAYNSRTGPQITTYTYGTTLSDSKIAASTLLRYVDYPDSVGGSDRIAYTYNRQSQRTQFTDQRGCVHNYYYDLLGRLTNDCVTTLGIGVDRAVRQLAVAYEVRGMSNRLTSYDNPSVGSGNVVNDVALAYNSFGQLISDAQSHSGAVVPGTTSQVQYGYADGSSNTIRPTTLTYPNGRVITTSYGTTGGINDSLGRVDGLIDSGTTLVNYSYLGLQTPVQTTYPQPGIQYTLLGSSGGNSPAGDIYWGLDMFGRIIDSRWYNTGTSADIDRIKYGYDRASNRIWRQNPVATAAGAQFDEFYTNDGLERLKSMQRGTLNGSNTAITSPTFAQCWTLDPTGNWRGFNESTTGSAWTTIQSRTANKVNEITGITNTIGGSWATPAYDAAGNMTTMPQPASPGSSYTATYDAWNRLISLSSSGTLVQQNQYDARNFRTVIQTYTRGTLTETWHSYFSSDWRCIEEHTGTSTTAERQFVWGKGYIDDLVCRDRVSERLYALHDANWDVTSIVDTSATVQERYAYSAYGYLSYYSNLFAPRGNSSFTWETLYRGYRFDIEFNLYLVRRRSFHAILGVWTQRDPFVYTDGTSLYTAYFVPNSTDPFGTETYPHDFVGPLRATDDRVKVPCHFTIYVGHNRAVFEMIAADFGSGHFERDIEAMKMEDGKTLTIPYGTSIAGIGCGVRDPKRGRISINDWIVKYYRGRQIDGVPRSADDVIQPDKATKLLREALKTARHAASTAKYRSRCSSVTIRVECDQAYRSYLEEGRWIGFEGEPKEGFQIGDNDRQLCNYSETIKLE